MFGVRPITWLWLLPAFVGWWLVGPLDGILSWDTLGLILVVSGNYWFGFFVARQGGS